MINTRRTTRSHAPSRPSRPSGVRSGFTLVEMLVSTALVVLMMSMFSTVFQLAAGAMSRQKGMAENDQRARTLTTIIRNDLRQRTFERVIPWDAGEDVSNDPSRRRGYFYISENQPDVDTDDVLQFTIEVPPGEALLFGRADLLGTVGQVNQPEGDDGQIEFDGTDWTVVENNTGASRWAEVSYFLRNGNLYRRVLLVREPYDGSSAPPTVPPFDPGLFAGDFWQLFDYSGFLKGVGDFELNTSASLDNASGAGSFPIALPFTRFGHHFDEHTAAGEVVDGQPREYTDDTDVNTFIGRFTQEETSHPEFKYPGDVIDWDGDMNNDFVMSRESLLGLYEGIVSYREGTDGNFGTDDDVRFDTAGGSTRRGADLLLSNVHAFDVKVWDEAIGIFMDIGHTDKDGDFYQTPEGQDATADPDNRNLQIASLTYGPFDDDLTDDDDQRNRVFDTWHPELDFDNADGDDDHTTQTDRPPFRPVSFGADGAPGVAGIDDDGDGDTDYLDPPTNSIPDPDEVEFPGSDDFAKNLLAIQITIRFLDPSTRQLRQLTIIEALNPKD